MDSVIKIHEERIEEKEKIGPGERGDRRSHQQQHSHYSLSPPCWGVISAAPELCYVSCLFFSLAESEREGEREITVLYPCLADWSESRPYSALPRPGLEP